MRIRKKLPTLERLKELLYYDPIVGLFIWKKTNSNVAKLGSFTGIRNRVRGYRVIGIDGKVYSAHVIAFYYFYGEPPKNGFEIDHKNRNRGDNRICNLRQVTVAENRRNKTIQSNNKLGYKGVQYHSQTGKYRARVRKEGITYSCGLHDTPELAHEAHNQKSKELFGDFWSAG